MHDSDNKELNDIVSEFSLKLDEIKSFAKVILTVTKNNCDDISQNDLENTMYLLVEKLSEIINNFKEVSSKLRF